MCQGQSRRQRGRTAKENKSVPNGTYLTFFGCPFLLTSALADRRVFISMGKAWVFVSGSILPGDKNKGSVQPAEKPLRMPGYHGLKPKEYKPN